MLQELEIDIILNPNNPLSVNSIKALVKNYLLQRQDLIPNSAVLSPNEQINDFINNVLIGDVPNYAGSFVKIDSYKIQWNIYSLDTDGPTLQTESAHDGEISIAIHLTLPSKELFTLWENLYYDNNIKVDLLNYATSMMQFSRKNINTNIISCNRVILLHGPPGSGKTSLCRAIAQKLTIKMNDIYNSGILIEINSHSLFSKYFSESGKIITNTFTRIKEICENKNILVCVLMDEVESLAHARNRCSSGSDPSDAVRVVNAMLTQIDQIKRYSNVLILATSNMTEAIDLAFVDRADIKQYLGLPSVTGICKIYQTCLVELINVNVIKSTEDTMEYRKKLLQISEKSTGLSGRTLKKIPFLAHALYLPKVESVNMDEFLDAMDKAVEREHTERAELVRKK